MNAVIAQIRQEDDARLMKDQARYSDLIVKGNLAADEVLELRGLMERLGKTHELLQADHNTLQQALRMEQAIAAAVGIEGPMQAAARAVSAHYEETQKIIARRESEKRTLSVEAERLGSTFSAAQSTTHHLRSFVNQHPDLLRHRHPQLVTMSPDPNRPIPGGVASDLR